MRSASDCDFSRESVWCALGHGLRGKRGGLGVWLGWWGGAELGVWGDAGGEKGGSMAEGCLSGGLMAVLIWMVFCLFW